MGQDASIPISTRSRHSSCICSAPKQSGENLISVLPPSFSFFWLSHILFWHQPPSLLRSLSPVLVELQVWSKFSFQLHFLWHAANDNNNKNRSSNSNKIEITLASKCISFFGVSLLVSKAAARVEIRPGCCSPFCRVFPAVRLRWPRLCPAWQL